jgi:glycine/D-amino acid oxidase-like deaminating enzyme
VRVGDTSFWWASLDGAPPRRAPLPGPLDCDVAIVGAGYTGLWTAYYLKRAEPSLHVVVLEREHAGFGASGRNGGWVSGLLAGSRERWAAEVGREPVIAAQRAMFATVDEVARVCAEERIECDWAKAGSLDVARSGPALARLRAKLDWQRSWGFGDEDWRQTDATAGVDGVRGAVFTPHCARVHPAKLVRGLAEAVERLGVPIYEGTEVAQIRPAGAETVAIATTSASAEVRARWVVRATEGFTHELAPRRLIPMNSSMIVTAPLTDAVGWSEPFTLRDAAHVFVYLQRTADNRIAIGGRGVPYRYGSRTDTNGEVADRTITDLRRRLGDLWPQLKDVAIDHAWCGVLGVSRDWCPAVTAHDGLATAGGYVGDGVSTANLAGRTLRDLILGHDTELARLPWTGHRAKRWEPEPLRYAGVRTVYRLYRAADAREERTQRPSRLAALADRVAGR